MKLVIVSDCDDRKEITSPTVEILISFFTLVEFSCLHTSYLHRPSRSRVYPSQRKRGLRCAAPKAALPNSFPHKVPSPWHFTHSSSRNKIHQLQSGPFAGLPVNSRHVATPWQQRLRISHRTIYLIIHFKSRFPQPSLKCVVPQAISDKFRCSV